MAATIPSWIVGLRGQCVKQVAWDEARDALVFHCDRDRRFTPVDHRTGSRGTVNRRLRRYVQDLPVWGARSCSRSRIVRSRSGPRTGVWNGCRSSSPATASRGVMRVSSASWPGI